MQLNCTNNIFLNGKKHKLNRNYTTQEAAVMQDMKNAALVLGWKDIYTGKSFTKNLRRPSIEHLIPYSLRKTPEIKAKAEKGFKINGLDNIFPVGKIENTSRSDEAFVDVVVKEPKVLHRLLDELEKYKNYKSDLIDGNEWHKRLYKTVTECLTGLCSDIKSKKMFVSK